MLLDVDTALHVDVEHHVLTCAALAFDLLFEGAIEAVVVDFLKLQELVALNLGTELLGSKEEILNAILLLATWRTAGARDGETQFQLRVLLHQPLHNG